MVREGVAQRKLYLWLKCAVSKIGKRKCGTGEAYPDFTIINVHTGKITYWEHAGLMDDGHYVNEFIRKMNSYVANGFAIGRDVAVSYETQGLTLDIKVVKRMVQDIIR